MADIDLDDQNQLWRKSANCLGCSPSLFYTIRGESTKQAKAVCAGCSVSQECLQYAIANSERYGIWGGLSERQRRNVRAASKAS